MMALRMVYSHGTNAATTGIYAVRVSYSDMLEKRTPDVGDITLRYACVRRSAHSAIVKRLISVLRMLVMRQNFPDLSVPLLSMSRTQG
jgi:hypothetical protein